MSETQKMISDTDTRELPFSETKRRDTPADLPNQLMMYNKLVPQPGTIG